MTSHRRRPGHPTGSSLFSDRRSVVVAPLDRQHWVGPEAVRNTFFAPNEGDADLSPNWESASGAIAASALDMATA